MRESEGKRERRIAREREREREREKCEGRREIGKACADEKVLTGMLCVTYHHQHTAIWQAI